MDKNESRVLNAMNNGCRIVNSDGKRKLITVTEGMWDKVRVVSCVSNRTFKFLRDKGYIELRRDRIHNYCFWMPKEI